MSGRGAIVLLAALLVTTGCASTPMPTTSGEAVFTVPGEGLMVLEAEGTATLSLRSDGPGVLEIHESYEGDEVERSRRFGPGTRLLRRFRGEARIRFVGAAGSRCRVLYLIEGAADVTVSGHTADH